MSATPSEVTPQPRIEPAAGAAAFLALVVEGALAILVLERMAPVILAFAGHLVVVALLAAAAFVHWRACGRSTPLFVLLAIVLCVLVLLPLFWLGYYALTNKAGSFTLANFARLFTDPTIRRAFLISLAMAGCVGFFSCVVATPLAWLVARTDMPGQRLVRSLVTASFVTPPFLGAIAWAAENREDFTWTIPTQT